MPSRNRAIRRRWFQPSSSGQRAHVGPTRARAHAPPRPGELGLRARRSLHARSNHFVENGEAPLPRIGVPQARDQLVAATAEHVVELDDPVRQLVHRAEQGSRPKRSQPNLDPLLKAVVPNERVRVVQSRHEGAGPIRQIQLRCGLRMSVTSPVGTSRRQSDSALPLQIARIVAHEPAEERAGVAADHLPGQLGRLMPGDRQRHPGRLLSSR
jgi:hypothetical protein